jgi:hypothetical protein
VSGDPPWVATAAGLLADTSTRPAADTAAVVVPAADVSSARAELDATREVASPEEAIKRLKGLMQTLPEGSELSDIAQLRVKNLEAVLGAARTARLSLDPAQLVAGRPARFAEDVQRAFRVGLQRRDRRARTSRGAQPHR